MGKSCEGLLHARHLGSVKAQPAYYEAPMQRPTASYTIITIHGRLCTRFKKNMVSGSCTILCHVENLRGCVPLTLSKTQSYYQILPFKVQVAFMSTCTLLAVHAKNGSISHLTFYKPRQKEAQERFGILQQINLQLYEGRMSGYASLLPFASTMVWVLFESWGACI